MDFGPQRLPKTWPHVFGTKKINFFDLESRNWPRVILNTTIFPRFFDVKKKQSLFFQKHGLMFLEPFLETLLENTLKKRMFFLN